MSRFKRSYPSIIQPENLKKDPECEIDKLSDYCRYYEYSVEICAMKTNISCMNGSSIPGREFDYPMGFFQFDNPVLSVGVVIHCLLTMLCFLLSALFVLLLIFRSKQLKIPIYKLILQLSICYLLFAIAQCLTSIPLYLFDRQKTSELISRIPLILEQLGSFGGVIFYSLLTLNRMAIFLLNPLKPMFEGKSLSITLFIGWFISVTAALFSSFLGCARNFDIPKGVFYDSCVPGSRIILTIREILFYAVVTLPFIDLFVYIIIGISIFVSRRKADLSIRRSEIELFIQSAVIVTLYTVTDAIYFLCPYIQTRKVESIYLIDLFTMVSMFSLVSHSLFCNFKQNCEEISERIVYTIVDFKSKKDKLE